MLTGPMGAAISTPIPIPASTSWMPDSTICAPSCKAGYPFFGRTAARGAFMLGGRTSGDMPLDLPRSGLTL
jgi:hypothetical protein